MLPTGLRDTVTGIWGETGTAWLAGLPGLIADVAADWALQVGPPYPLSINWVAPAVRADGTLAVVKLGVPDGHLDHEAEALRAYGGNGAARLLAADRDRGALLIERVDPGEPAATLVPADDAAATAALISVGNRLHRPAPPGCVLPHLRTEGAAFGRHLSRFPSDDPLPRRLVTHAAGLFAELCDSATDLLLHGDLHHDNVLRATREPWLAIDPHGVIGDPGYDCGAMLYNPWPDRLDESLLALVPARIEQLADGFRLPVERVTAWGFVMAVLSEVWGVQDGGPVGGHPLGVATSLYPRVRRS